MKNIVIVLGIIIVLLLVALFFVQERPLPLEEIPQNTESVEPTRVESSYGFSYSYPSGPGGYTLLTPENAAEGDLVFVQSLFDTEAYTAFANNNQATEPPPSLTIEVFRNPMNLSAREWVMQNNASNYQLSTNGSLTEQTLGTTNFLTYQYDGLYRTDAYVYGQDGYIYVFSNMWTDQESDMVRDMEAVIASVQWSLSETPAQVAHGDITVTSPNPGEAVTSPLTIEGSARGFWFFEATFPVVLTNWDGLIIAEGFATAEGEWMTEDFVPFSAELTFTTPENTPSNRGTLILQKANPSGLPENDDAIEIPIVFQ